MAINANAHRLRASISSSLQAEETEFLRLEETFSDCKNPTILDGNQLGIFSFKGAQQECIDDSTCQYFLYNNNDNSVYLCHEDEGFTKSSPATQWSMGIRPGALHVNPFEAAFNTQAICADIIDEKEVENMREVMRQAQELDAGVVVINMNKGKSADTIATMTAFFCNGSTETLSRNGFVTLKRRSASDAHFSGPSPPATITAPCGLNGSIQSDSSKAEEGVNEGDIVPAKRLSGSEI